MYSKQVVFIVLLAAVCVVAEKSYQERFNEATEDVRRSIAAFQDSYLTNSVTDSAMDSMRTSLKHFNDFASQTSSELSQEVVDSVEDGKKQLAEQLSSMIRQMGLDASEPSQISQFKSKLQGATPDSMRSFLNEMFTTYGYVKGAAANQWWTAQENVATMTQSYADALWNNQVAQYLTNKYHQYFAYSPESYQEEFQRAAEDVTNSMQQFQAQYFTTSTSVTNDALESLRVSFQRFNDIYLQAPDNLSEEISRKMSRTKFLLSQQVTALMRHLGIDSNETSKLSDLQSKFKEASSDSMRSFLNEMFTTYGYVKGSVATEWWNVKENVAEMIKSYTNALWNNQVTEYLAKKYHQYISPIDAAKQEL